MGFCQDLLKEEGRVGKAPRILDRALTYFELIDQSFDGIESLSVANQTEIGVDLVPNANRRALIALLSDTAQGHDLARSLNRASRCGHILNATTSRSLLRRPGRDLLGVGAILAAGGDRCLQRLSRHRRLAIRGWQDPQTDLCMNLVIPSQLGVADLHVDGGRTRSQQLQTCLAGLEEIVVVDSEQEHVSIAWRSDKSVDALNVAGCPRCTTTADHSAGDGNDSTSPTHRGAP